MPNIQNEICDPTYLMDLCRGATQAFSMIYSACQWTGGTPLEFPDIYLPLRTYSGGTTRWDWSLPDDFDWTKIALVSYVGIPELYRQHYSHLVTDYKSLFPTFSGIPPLNLISSSDGSPEVVLDNEPITNGVWYQKQWVTGDSRWAARGICPPPSAVWHGTWPSGYEYRTLPELENAFGVVTFLGGFLLPLTSQWDLEHVQSWSVFHGRNRGYSFAGSGPTSDVNDWESAGVNIDLTAFMVNDTSGFVPLDIACTATTAGGTPFTSDYACNSDVKVIIRLRGYGSAQPGVSGEVPEYASSIWRILNSSSPGASLAVGVTHADLQADFPHAWPALDSNQRPLMSPYSAVRIQAQIEAASSVMSRTTAPSGTSTSWGQSQTVGGSYAHLRIGPYEFEVSA